jgi:HK97 family phage major capsid protein
MKRNWLLLNADPAAGGGGLAEVKTLLQSGIQQIGEQAKRFDTIELSHKATADEVAKVAKQLDDVRKAQLAHKASAPAKPGHVSDSCARQLGAIYLLAGLQQERLEGRAKENAAGLYKDITGIEVKTALSTSDIPLPVVYGAEVVELVSLYGNARKYGTVFPMGSSVVKLPKLSTDTTFTLNAISASITEKSPATAWVTFTAEKFGGLIRLPTEIDEDSIFAMGQFLARYSARNIARAEDHNFFVGTGAASGVNGTAEGLTTNTITNSKVTQMATTKTKYSDATLTNLRTVRSVVDAAAIGMGAYYAHPSFEQHLSTLNTAGDKPYQANGLGGATLDGFPIRWVDIMPAYSTSANVSKVFVLFGDVSFQYLGVRGGVRFDTSKDAGFATDEILVRALERFTIGLMANGAVSGLQTAAS